METLPNRSSDAGPESKDPGYDWRDELDFAGDEKTYAIRAMAVPGKIPEARNAERIHHIDLMVEHALRAKELLCR